MRPERIVVVVRRGDAETLRGLQGVESLGLEVVQVAEPGQVAALRAGAASTDSSFIAFTDDDAVPRPDWLCRLVEHFSDQSVGGVGGRDVVHHQGRPSHASTADVGRISSWGKLVGNHHIGLGSARRVTVLKGVNMAFRREALAFASGLRGCGAQAHNEVAMCLFAKARGWQLVYDPQAVVDHYPAERFDDDNRAKPAASATTDAAYNLTATLMVLAPELRRRRLTYGILVGDRGVPGIGRSLTGVTRRHDRDLLRRLLPSLMGQLSAYHDWRSGRGIVIAAPTKETAEQAPGPP